MVRRSSNCRLLDGSNACASPAALLLVIMLLATSVVHISGINVHLAASYSIAYNNAATGPSHTITSTSTINTAVLIADDYATSTGATTPTVAWNGTTGEAYYVDITFTGSFPPYVIMGDITNSQSTWSGPAVRIAGKNAINARTCIGFFDASYITALAKATTLAEMPDCSSNVVGTFYFGSSSTTSTATSFSSSSEKGQSTMEQSSEQNFTRTATATGGTVQDSDALVSYYPSSPASYVPTTMSSAGGKLYWVAVLYPNSSAVTAAMTDVSKFTYLSSSVYVSSLSPSSSPLPSSLPPPSTLGASTARVAVGALLMPLLVLLVIIMLV